MSNVLKEAERLYKLGFAIHWLKPKSKAPVKSKWTTGGRESWESLRASFRSDYNVGVRLGTPSRINEKFLAVIDIDVKSTDKKHQAEAEAAVLELFPELPKTYVQVMSGRGNGSSHIYILTPTPAAPSKRKVSSEKVKVLMPSAAINKSQQDQLSEEDLNEGYRMRPAWEVAVMGEGQQVVLPPSLHPDSGRAYAWKHKLNTLSDLHEVDLGRKEKDIVRETTNDWKPEEVDLITSSLSDETLALIEKNDGEDGSASLFKVVIEMVKQGWTDREIMSVLTDTNYELGKVAFNHAKTSSRSRAANWLFNYNIKKARKEHDAQLQFDGEVVVSNLTEEDAKAQEAELSAGSLDWRNLIERNGPTGANANAPRATLKNLVLILSNEVSGDVFKRDTFSYRDFYAYPTPWGGVKNAAITDDDAVKIKFWLGQRYRFEPPTNLIFEAITVLAEKNSVDPVVDMLETLPAWDFTPRLDGWLKKNFQAEGPEEYLAQVFRKWLIALVMRAYDPGAKFDWMPIFEGAQGIGKSSFGRLLVGDKFFLDWLPNLGDKDAALGLQGIWLVEMGELANLRKTELETVKAFLTRQIDKIRPPYGKKVLEVSRRCVFFGTTNAETYLRDESGNRRFKPVKVGQLNFEALESEREQLFAEAIYLFKNGFEDAKTLDLEGEARIYEKESQAEKMVANDIDVYAELILDAIERDQTKPEDERFNYKKFKLMWLFEGRGPLESRRLDGRNIQFVAQALRRIGAKHSKIQGNMWWKLEKGIGLEGVKQTDSPNKNTKEFDPLQF